MPSGQLATVISRLRRAIEPDMARHLSDATLLERFVQNHDDSAFELLVWRHGGMVWDLCRRMLRRSEDTEDAFQATFLALVRKAASIRKSASVGSWLYKVAFRAALEARKRSARQAFSERRAFVLLPPDPQAEACWRELHPLFDEEICRLPEKYRAPLILCCMEGKSLDEAARQLGCPRATAGTRLARARERLRRGLMNRGVAVPAGAVLAAICARGTVSAGPPAKLVDAAIRAALAYWKTAGTCAASTSALTLAKIAHRSSWFPKLWLLT